MAESKETCQGARRHGKEQVDMARGKETWPGARKHGQKQGERQGNREQTKETW